jgi:hypothetical protein
MYKNETISSLLDLKMSSMKNKDCFICENELRETDDVVITDCNHTFHRNCAQERLDTRQKSNCPICQEDLAVIKALSRDVTTNITKSMEERDEPQEDVRCFFC